LEAEIQAAIQSFSEFEIEVFGTDLNGVVATARAHNLTAYDASYLWLARDLGCELVTLDARLKSASANL
jgi:predicted nucleic acid-binding protein